MSLAEMHAALSRPPSPVSSARTAASEAETPRSSALVREEDRGFGVHFHAGESLAEAAAELSDRRFVVVRAPSVGAPGGLRRAIDDAVEGALALRGALPPAVDVEAPLDAVVRDQIFRARALGSVGLAIALARISSDGSPVAGEDAMTLETWLFAARTAPVALLFDEIDRATRVVAPVGLGDLVRPRERADYVPRSKPRPIATRRPVFVPVDDEPIVEQAASAPAVEPPFAAIDADASPTPPEARPAVDEAADRDHAAELDRARGPKPVGTVAKLFVAHYAPLVGSVARGDASEAVRGVVDTFRKSFEHSWREGFAAVRVTGKRPPMVFDAFELAAKVARQCGARATKLVLVDAMRFDLGQRVETRLAERLAGRAACVERGLLWAAAPTTTSTQLTLLARGPEGLRDLEPPSEPEPDVSRGRAVSSVRRERLGAREIGKLDIVEARLRGSGPAFDARMDRIADETAEALARHLEGLAPRTLAFIFGDHGFRIGPTLDGKGTTAATQGGLSPEEVLVGAQAWLVGGMH